LLPPTPLSLHEPIIINFQIKNEGRQVVSLDLGQDTKGGFLFTVTSPDGTALHLPQYRHEGISQYGSVSVQPGESFSQTLILNEWHDDFKIPGKYKLEARLTTPILVGETLQRRDSGFIGEISITPRDPARLNKVCAELETQAEGASTVEASQEPTRALSYVEDSIAVPYLARVLSAHTLSYEMAITGLARIGNDAAIEVLLSALNENYGDIPDAASRALSQMEDRISSPRLKETVRKAVQRSSERARNEFIKTQIAYLDYRDPDLQATAIQTLMKMDQNALEQAEPVLKRLAADPQQPANVVTAAKEALQRIHAPPK
jgi:hypothetical protein